jgi:hypothetical protein
MTTRIFWTAAERQRVLQRALTYMQQGNFGHFEAIKRAQDYELLSVRHRAFGTPSAAHELIKALKSMALQTPIKHKEVVTPINEEKTHSAPQVVPSEHVVSIDELVNSIAQKVAATLGAAIRAQLVREVKQLDHNFSIPKHNPTYDIVHETKKRVIIIGLLGDQIHSISREYGNAYDLKFIDTDRAMGMSPPDADAYLLMKNFINHPLYHKYQVFPNHVLIDGGMTTLRMWLNTKGKEL